MKIRKRNRILISIFFKFLIMAAIIIFYIYLFTPQNTYNVIAETEMITIEIAKDSYQKIPLKSAYYTDDFFSEELSPHSGSFKPNPGTKMTISRASEDNLRISIKLIDSKSKENESGEKDSIKEKSTGIFFNQKDEIDSISTTGDFIDFIVPLESSSKRMIIPFRGKVQLGINPFGNVPQSGSAILNGGKVQIIGEAIIGNSFYLGDTYALNHGDQIQIEKDSNLLADSYGIVLVDRDKPGLSVNYKSKAAQARIFTPGPVNNKQGYKLKESLVSRFSNDPFFIVIAWFGGMIILFAELLELKNEADIFLERNHLLGKKKVKERRE